MTYWLGVAVQTAIFMIAILGVSVLSGFSGLYTLGHAGFMAIGAYTSAILVRTFEVPIAVGLLAGMALATLVGLFIGAPTLRLKGDYFIIATLGIGEAIGLLAKYMIPLTNGPYGYTDYTSFRGMEAVYYVFPILLVVIIVTTFLIKSKHGRNFVALREDEIAAVTVGVNIYRYKMAAMAYSCALCGLVGGLFAHYMTNVNPNMFTGTKSNELVIAVVLGGRGSITGVILAAAILTPLPELLRFGSAQEWRLIIYGLTIVLMILFRPNGLMGDKEFSIRGLIRLICRIPKALEELNKRRKDEQQGEEESSNE